MNMKNVIVYYVIYIIYIMLYVIHNEHEKLTKLTIIIIKTAHYVNLSIWFTQTGNDIST